MPFVLSATSVLPPQTPFESVATQVPFKDTLPAPHRTQSSLVEPVHVWHKLEQAVHVAEALDPKNPEGQIAPVEVVVCGGVHCVRSVEL